MKIQLVSDLHLEFSPIELTNNGSDVLILSGDICVANHFLKSEASPKFAKAQEFRQFFHHVSQNWDKVFYVVGNHEHYHGRFEHTVDIMRDILPQNITLLEKSFEDYEGYRFIGGTLWTDIKNPVEEIQVEMGLNDFRLIQITQPQYRRFRVLDAVKDHRKLIKFIDENLTGNTIVIGHHAPSFESVSAEYRTGRYSYLNPAYCTELSEWILERPEIKLWTHGHVHSSHDYMIGDTRIIANPRGYDSGGNPENKDFSPGKIFDI